VGYGETEGGKLLRDPQDLSVGKHLQQERERKNLTLEAVSQATRISVRSLEAIENDDFIGLPAPVFIRSFLKTYASCVGLNPDKVIALYETQTGVIGLPPAKGSPPEKQRPQRIWLLGPLALLVLIAAGTYWLLSSPEAPSPPSAAVSVPPPAPAPPAVEEAKISPPPAAEPPQEPEKPPKPEPEKKPEAKVPPAPAKIQPPPPPAPAAVPAGAPDEEKKERRHILRVQAKEKTWVRVQADDQPEFEVLLEPQEKAVWTARRQLKITLGNAGGLDMAFDGKRVGPFGTSGQVVHLQFPLPEGKKPGE
jgi:cytoskeleton protein RodZ